MALSRSTSGKRIKLFRTNHRPIVLKTEERDFTDHHLIFYCNHLGEMGGFDLYYVGIERMIGR